MKLAHHCIKRPVFTWVIQILIIVFGYVAMQNLEVRELPRIDHPQVSVRTAYPGVDARVIETTITDPIESVLSSVEGVDTMSSTSKDSVSHVLLKFRSGQDLSEAVNRVRDKLQSIQAALPKDADLPAVSKADSDADPIIYLAIKDEQRSLGEISDFARRNVVANFEQIDGVAFAILYGERRYAVKILIDPKRLASFAITIPELNQAIRQQHQALGAGELQGMQHHLVVAPQGQVSSIDDINNMVVARNQDGVVHLSDVATVSVTPLNQDVQNRIDGENVLIMAIVAQSTANPVLISQAVQTEIEHTQAILPQGMDLEMVYDTADFIQASIHEVFSTLILATLLVVLVILGLMGQWRAAIIPIITILVCLIGIFSFMWWAGFSINLLTLLALVLAIGLVVDDAIVMVENIARHCEQGDQPLVAAKTATKEIGFAIVSMTLTLAAVYAPVGLQTGATGVLFREFAFTLAGAVLISGFVALSLAPMLSARLLGKKNSGLFAQYQSWLESKFVKITNGYQRALKVSLQQPSLVLIAFIGLLIFGVLVYQHLNREIVPTEDQGFVFAPIMAPAGASAQYTNYWVQQVEQQFANVPDKQHYLAFSGFPSVNNGFSLVVLKPWEQRAITASQVRDQLMPGVTSIPGVSAFPLLPANQDIGGGRSIEFVITTRNSYRELAALVQSKLAELKQNPIFQNLESKLKFEKDALNVFIKRDLAGRMGVDLAQIGDSLNTAITGRKVGRFNFQNQSYDMLVQAPKKLRSSPDILQQLFVKNNVGQMLPLANLIKVIEQAEPVALSHFGKQRSAMITAQLATGASFDQAVEDLSKLGKQLPKSFSYAFEGNLRKYIRSKSSMLQTFALSLLVIFLVLAAQFESFRKPLIIMCTVPVSVAGALLVLQASGGTNNIYSQIALITLVGLISKHGILIVEFANQLQQQISDRYQRIIKASSVRLRPILMTTLAMSLGALPLALASGPGSVARQNIGWVIVGGMLIGSIFSLFVIPAAYVLFTRKE